MSRMQRLRAVFAGLCMIAFAVILAAIVSALTGIIIEVVSLRYYSCYFADTRSAFTVKLNGCCRC